MALAIKADLTPVTGMDKVISPDRAVKTRLRTETATRHPSCQTVRVKAEHFRKGKTETIIRRKNRTETSPVVICPKDRTAHRLKCQAEIMGKDRKCRTVNKEKAKTVNLTLFSAIDKIQTVSVRKCKPKIMEKLIFRIKSKRTTLMLPHGF